MLAKAIGIAVVLSNPTRPEPPRTPPSFRGGGRQASEDPRPHPLPLGARLRRPWRQRPATA
jgi:hypothetical protein